ncbi:hypothetical protein EDB80DRAFT_703908 [Ilyonectria destructans]|nr:hypothetical protein EDB80DRAFT_703908 [Ilyonectria destructans]
MTQSQRERCEAEIEDPDSDPLTRRQVAKPWTIHTLSALVAMIATAWTLFLQYLS